MVLTDKDKFKPVLDVESEVYKKHRAIEIKKDNVEYMFNCGYSPAILRLGSLDVESINASIRKYVIYYIKILIKY